MVATAAMAAMTGRAGIAITAAIAAPGDGNNGSIVNFSKLFNLD